MTKLKIPGDDEFARAVNADLEKIRGAKKHKAEANGHDAKAKPIRFRLVPFDELEPDDEPEYLIDGWLPREGICVVWGPPKCGKTFMVLDACLHVALGLQYRDRTVAQAPVIYCAFEGERGFKKRAKAARLYYKNKIKGPVPLFVINGRADLIADHKALIADIRAQHDNPGVVVLDTLNKSLNGSESKDEDMGRYIGAADAVRAAFICLVIIVHHCGLSGDRPRGHTSLTGALDVQISVTRDAAKNIVATTEAMKDDCEGEQIVSRFEVVEVGRDKNGKPITSCVVIPSEGVATAGRHIKLTDNQRRFFAILDTAITEAPADLTGIGNVPHGVKAVTRTDLKRYLVVGGWVEAEPANKGRAQVSQMLNKLAGKGAVGATDEHVWIIK
jgi:hypothetical protein